MTWPACCPSTRLCQEKNASRNFGKRVFIGGNFTITANHSGTTVTRTYLASENATSGALLDWKPSLNGRVYSLAVSPNHKTLYVAGSFTKVNGKSRTHVASFDIASGGLTSARAYGLGQKFAPRSADILVMGFSGKR